KSFPSRKPAAPKLLRLVFLQNGSNAFPGKSARTKHLARYACPPQIHLRNSSATNIPSRHSGEHPIFPKSYNSATEKHQNSPPNISACGLHAAVYTQNTPPLPESPLHHLHINSHNKDLSTNFL